MNIPIRRYQNLLLGYLKPQWPRVALLALVLLTSIGLELLNPQILRSFIDAATAQGPQQELISTALLFIGVALLHQLLSVAATYFSENVGWRATNALRADLAAHCLALDLSFHNARTPGELIERVDGDVSTLANFFSRFVVVVVGSSVLLLGILALVVREDARAGLLFLAVSAASLSFSVWARRIGARYAVAQRQASAELFAFLEERLIALPDIQANGAQAYVLYRAQLLLRELFRRAQKAVF